MGTIPVDRASDADLAFLAMDAGPVPEQFGAAVLLDPGGEFDPARAERLLAERLAAVPRLGQRLFRPPPGCGRAVWADDDRFDPRRHLSRLACPSPGDEQALVDTAVRLVVDRLPRDRPLWRAALVTGLAGGRVALVVVLHHAVADGIGGLAVLRDLADPAGPAVAPAARVPRPRPGARQLAADAWAARRHAVRRARTTWRQLRASMAAGGGLRPERAAPCSLLRPTGPRQRMTVVHADVAAVRAAAHRLGGTVNAALVTVVARALHTVLRHRAEAVGRVMVAVPVAARRETVSSGLGNKVSPLVLAVPTAARPAEQVAGVAAAVRARRGLATGPPPIALLGAAFRIAAGLGGYRWYMTRQRRIHTVVSYVHGPDVPLRFAGAPIRAVIPLAVSQAGNLTVRFEALSYAGTLTVTALTDPDAFPDVPVLARALRAELDALTAVTVPCPGPGSPPGGAG
ncbi:wax ester/triacylglycerol synthase domain-containing protein [Spirilliplanes yamanashiensis]|uniref:diacylglycerol O-acyltransferase n=1 Tax=Spirilliplanes yamanashiensis TaxID=42233 RepID=A0A8J4DMR5_9ACTN|nr:wax ester/triacylglycerol synthase domain-containing protein [Spirilliplanes yamanashiensis]MDP9818239.1 WS/DGAT/MGAT family acyltransferase [Spirilliplanes yamanashiensis]GIJ06733.1 diacylglycerol O-acyltransferase [Spirilliplanes yamanashiensis]